MRLPSLGTTRRRLLLLACAILLPPAIFAAILSLEFASTERSRVRADALAMADRTVDTVDLELTAAEATVRALASSPSLINGDMADFRRQAAEVLQRRGLAVVLRDHDGQQLFNSLLPPGAPLPRTTDPELLRTDAAVFATGAPALSGLHWSATAGRQVVSVAVPVWREGTIRSALALAIDPAQLAAVLVGVAPPGWVLGLVDRSGIVVARTLAPGQSVGRPANADLLRHVDGPTGLWTGTSLEGRAVLGAYARSPVSGWVAAVAVPLGVIGAPVRQLVGIVAVSGLVTVLIAVALAVAVARTISGPMTALARAAGALERGETVPPLRTALREVDAVGAALLTADRSMRSRAGALAQSEERFRAAVRAVEGVMWTNDAAGRMIGEQPGWSALTGQHFEEYQGLGWADAVHPDDAQPTILAWEEAVRDHRPFVFAHRLRRADGSYRKFAIRAVPVLDAAGAASAWVGVHTDVTDEEAARQTLARREAELRDLNATLERRVAETSAERDRIWRTSPELMLVVQFDGTVVATNPAWRTALGWAEAELHGRSLLELLHPDDVQRTVGEFGRLVQGQPSFGFENRLRGRDGGERRFAWTSVGEAGFVHAIGRDITAEHAAAAALQRAEEQLRQAQKMEVVGQLTGGVAHDFNNLLTVVTGHLEMARRRLDSDKDAARLRRNLDAALEGARRAAVLTHRLLAFSRQSALQPQVVDLNAILLGMEELIRRTLGEPISVDLALDPALIRVRADPNQFENAVLNLCVNARDAMPDGGVLRIATANAVLGASAPPVLGETVPPGTYAAVAVADTGTGIPHEIQERVFEPFFTTKPVGKGTGLGLSQVFGFVTQSGGAVEIASRPNEGTSVRLLFPATDAAPAPAPAPEPAAEPQAGVSPGATCLVVEDEDMVRDFSVTALEEAGFRVLQAADGRAGLQVLDEHAEIRLLFTDIVLAGGVSGLDLAHAARARRPDLLVLYTTGYNREAGEMDRAVEGDVLPKPFTSAALVTKVGALLAAG